MMTFICFRLDEHVTRMVENFIFPCTLVSISVFVITSLPIWSSVFKNDPIKFVIPDKENQNEETTQ